MTKTPVVLDFETYYDKDYTLRKLTTEQYIRDPRFKVHGVAAVVDGEAQWVAGDEVGPFLLSLELHTRPVIMHHAHFDGLILSERYGIYPLLFIDTLSMARAVTPGSLKLSDLAERYCIGIKESARLEDVKGVLDPTPAQLEALGEYAKHDVLLTQLLFNVLRGSFPVSEMMIIDAVVKMYTRPVLEIDGDIMRAAADADANRTADLLRELNMEATQLASNEQFAAVLQSLGIDPPRKKSVATGADTWAFSKQDREFTDLLEHEDERVSALVSARLGVKSTIARTRAEMLHGISKRGAWPVYLRYSGARQTHRLSGGEKANPQNFTRGSLLRKAVCAPQHLPPWMKKAGHGYTLVACDSSNIELRVNMVLAGQRDVIEMLRRGDDLYCAFASERFGRAITKADKMERQYGKVCHLALGYGMGWRKFIETARLQAKQFVTELDAQETVSLYRSMYPAIPAFWRSAELALPRMAVGEYVNIGPTGLIVGAHNGIIKPSGMPLMYDGLRQKRDNNGFMVWTFTAADEKSGRPVTKYTYGGKLVENIVQSVARDIVCEQMVEIAKRWPVVMQVHDEVVVAAPKREAELVAKEMERIMSTSPKWMPEIPLAAEADWGFRYGDCK